MEGYSLQFGIKTACLNHTRSSAKLKTWTFFVVNRKSCPSIYTISNQKISFLDGTPDAHIHTLTSGQFRLSTYLLIN